MSFSQRVGEENWRSGLKEKLKAGLQDPIEKPCEETLNQGCEASALNDSPHHVVQAIHDYRLVAFLDRKGSRAEPRSERGRRW